MEFFARYVPNRTSITAQKVWEDEDNASKHRPDSIILKLYADDTPVNDSERTVSEECSWRCSWDDLRKWNNNGQLIQYRVEETAVKEEDGFEYYRGDCTQDDEGTFVVTNTLAYVDVTVQKIVGGGFGDRNKEFAFTATYRDGSEDKRVEFSLRHGASYKIKVPVDAELVVSEANEGYEVYDANGDPIEPVGMAATQTISVGTQDCALTFKNVKEGTPDTGVVLDSLPYIVILAVAVLGVALMVRRRRRGDD